MIKHTFLFFVLIAFSSSLLRAQSDKLDSLSEGDRLVVKKANTARYAFFMGRQCKDFILLMNLARTDGAVMGRYITCVYGADYITKLPMTSILGDQRKRELLRPSFGLYMSAWVHSVVSGIKGTAGHGAFGFRILIFLNFNTLLSGVASGENCEYGSKKAIDIFESLMNSPHHKANIMNPLFMRVGVSKKFHTGYTHNTVTVFSGPKLRDMVFRSEVARRVKRGR